jgi:hypothetical protein
MANRRPVFAEVEADDTVVYTAPDMEETIVEDTLVSARVKGTWVMTWGTERFDFEDGKRYRIPKDLFNYLKARSCIYDTM